MGKDENLYNQVMRRLREHEDKFREDAPAEEEQEDGEGELTGLEAGKVAETLAREPKFRELHDFVMKYPEEGWMFGRAVRDRLAHDHENISNPQKAAVLAALRKKLGG